MKFAELSCEKCGTFIITFAEDIPNMDGLCCPNCDNGDRIRVIKLDGRRL